MRTGLRVARDTAVALALLVGSVAGALWLASVLSFRPPAQTFNYLLAGLILGGAGVLLALFAALVAIWRADRYDNRPRSALLPSQLVIVTTLAVYLGLLSVGAIDRIAHEGQRHWRVLSEPEIVVLSNLIVAGLLIGPAWYLYEVQMGRGWSRRTMIAFYVAGAVLYALVIAAALVLGSTEP